MSLAMVNVLPVSPDHYPNELKGAIKYSTWRSKAEIETVSTLLMEFVWRPALPEMHKRGNYHTFILEAILIMECNASGSDSLTR